MKVVIQRVTSSNVVVDNRIVGEIGKGLTILLGVGKDDSQKDIDFFVDKISNLRIFSDDEGKMNRSLLDVQGELLIVSQFTLYGDCRKGRRPSFIDAAPPTIANELYENFCQAFRAAGIHVQTGIFQADMKVTIENDGPVTFVLESPRIE